MIRSTDKINDEAPGYRILAKLTSNFIGNNFIGILIVLHVSINIYPIQIIQQTRLLFFDVSVHFALLLKIEMFFFRR